MFGCDVTRAVTSSRRIMDRDYSLTMGGFIMSLFTRLREDAVGAFMFLGYVSVFSYLVGGIVLGAIKA